MTLDGRDTATWGGALLVVLALHAGAVVWLLQRPVPLVVQAPPAPDAVMLDLAPALPPIEPAATTPPTPVAPAPPPPPLAESEPPPPPPIPVDIPPTPPVPAEAVLPLPEPPPPPPKPKPRPVQHILPRQAPPRPPVERETQPEPATAPVATAPAAAPAARPSAPPSNAVPTWQAALIGRLQAAKRYPDLARSRGDHGTATVSFTVDRAGRVLAVSLVRSTGSPVLDEEAVALVRRAEPLPPLPAEIPGPSVTLSVPISFAIR